MSSSGPFGTVKICPGCQKQIVSVHDEHKGPQAVSWHRRCLVCCTCRKALDSSAKVQVARGKRLVPSCTTCLVSHNLFPTHIIANNHMNHLQLQQNKVKREEERGAKC
jgi:hypothetical protein